MSKEIINAVIESTMLGIEDHGVFTCYVFVKAGSFGGGFGGYVFDQYQFDNDKRKGSGIGIEFIRATLETIGVEKWEDLKGKYCRIEHTGIGGRILRIGNITEDRWFDPVEIGFKKYAEVEKTT